MQISVTPLVAADQIAGWGLTPSGKVGLMVVASGVQVAIEFDSAEQARDVCVDGCAAVFQAMQIAQGNGAPKGMASRLVGSNGLPLGVTR